MIPIAEMMLIAEWFVASALQPAQEREGRRKGSLDLLSERATQLIMTGTADYCFQTADHQIKMQDNNAACQNISAEMVAEA